MLRGIFLRATRDNFQAAVGQRPLQFQCFFGWRRHPCFHFFWRDENDRHGLGMNCTHLFVGTGLRRAI